MFDMKFNIEYMEEYAMNYNKLPFFLQFITKDALCATFVEMKIEHGKPVYYKYNRLIKVLLKYIVHVKFLIATGIILTYNNRSIVPFDCVWWCS